MEYFRCQASRNQVIRNFLEEAKIAVLPFGIGPTEMDIRLNGAKIAVSSP